MSSNPIQIPIEANSQGSINCIANAMYYQRVTLVWAGKSIVFEGSGEGQPMQTSDGENVYLLEEETDGYVISALFQYSVNGKNGPFYTAKICAPTILNKGIFTIIQVTSEDSQDNDNNDSYLTIAIASTDAIPNKINTKSEELKDNKSAIDGLLNLHSKVYYNNPSYGGNGDEIIFNVEYDGIEGPVSILNTSWQRYKGTYYDQQTPFGGYIHVVASLFDNNIPGMEKAVLYLNTAISYWICRPTGFKSADWQATLRDCNYVITRVTT